MISSNSINYSKYSIINAQKTNLSNDLEINNQNNKIQETQKENIEKDSNSIIISSENENDMNDNDNLLTSSEKPTDMNPENLYGNKIEYLNPKFLGKCFAFLYNSNGNPRVTIGPDCKHKLNNIFKIRYA